jgi:hypothetical protein
VDVTKPRVDGRKTGVDTTNAGLDGSRDGVTEAAAVNEAVDVDNDRGVKPCGVPSLRPRGVKKDPTHILGGYGQNDFLFALMDADAQFSFLTEQMPLKRGRKHFKKKGLEALMAEMSQLHYRKTIKPVFADSMTREKKSQALRYLRHSGVPMAENSDYGRPKKRLVPLRFVHIHYFSQQSSLL